MLMIRYVGDFLVIFLTMNTASAHEGRARGHQMAGQRSLLEKGRCSHSEPPQANRLAWVDLARDGPGCLGWDLWGPLTRSPALPGMPTLGNGGDMALSVEKSPKDIRPPPTHLYHQPHRRREGTASAHGGQARTRPGQTRRSRRRRPLGRPCALLCAGTPTHALTSARSHPHTRRDHPACPRIPRRPFVNHNHEEQSGSRHPGLLEPLSRGLPETPALCPRGLLRTQGCRECVCTCVLCVALWVHCVGRRASRCGREDSVGRGGVREAPGAGSSQLPGFSQMLLQRKHLRLRISQRGMKDKKREKTLELFCYSPDAMLSQPLLPAA